MIDDGQLFKDGPSISGNKGLVVNNSGAVGLFVGQLFWSILYNPKKCAGLCGHMKYIPGYIQIL